MHVRTFPRNHTSQPKSFSTHLREAKQHPLPGSAHKNSHGLSARGAVESKASDYDSGVDTDASTKAFVLRNFHQPPALASNQRDWTKSKLSKGKGPDPVSDQLKARLRAAQNHKREVNSDTDSDEFITGIGNPKPVAGMFNSAGSVGLAGRGAKGGGTRAQLNLHAQAQGQPLHGVPPPQPGLKIPYAPYIPATYLSSTIPQPRRYPIPLPQMSPGELHPKGRATVQHFAEAATRHVINAGTVFSMRKRSRDHPLTAPPKSNASVGGADGAAGISRGPGGVPGLGAGISGKGEREVRQSIPPPDAITLQDTLSFDVVTSKMSAQEMFECLVEHGCKDLTSLTDTNGRPASVIASGGFGDVRRITLSDGTFAAVKTLRLHILLKDDDKGIKRAVREVYIWSRLRHPNIQELLGIIILRGALGMVSPWMKQGNLQQYLTTHPGINRYHLCVQFASGVSYLHKMGMVHGDLKANNVLVSDDGTLKINDFDHAILSNTTLRFSTTTRPGGGTLRWMAPELFEAEEKEENEPQPARTKKTDIYALGMTILEIYTSKVPYVEYRTDAGVFGAILQKRIPRRPSELSGSDKPTRRMWQLLEKCWDHDPAARPNAPSVLKHLHRYST